VNPPKAPTLSVVPDSTVGASNSAQVLQPIGWPAPKGYSNGMAADGRIVVTGGVIGWDAAGHLPEGFVAQARQTLVNISAILAEGGAGRDRGHRRGAAVASSSVIARLDRRPGNL